jgi:predicted transcriptional regulator
MLADMSNRLTLPMRAADKWQEAAKAGFQLLPDLLLRHQADLGLTATDLVVLINLTMHWWYPDQRPFPRSSSIAKRMGIDRRTVQRSLAKLSEKGLVEKVTENLGDGSKRQVCDLTGLQQCLSDLAKSDPVYLMRTGVDYGGRRDVV